jgi:hypothetical protein
MLFSMPRSRAQSLIANRTQRAVANRRAFPYLVVVTLVLGAIAGFVISHLTLILAARAIATAEAKAEHAAA